MQEVDLVDVEQPPVGLGEQAGAELGAAGAQGPGQIERATHSVVAGADGKFDKTDRATRGVAVSAVRAVGAVRLRGERVAAVAATGDDVDPGEHVDEPAHDGRLGRALLTANEHTTDGR
ncbi:hypothetical protein [Dermacoccus abyssi]|uniref:hypothetical protein n=1 Tax=Dermacoccus abyssi TaxID=322596 RepID=UPI001F4EBE02|nr:hypothetical protein [Dermacoccus abyssi]